MNLDQYILHSTENIFIEVQDAREAAHAKHGDQSIEAIDGADPRWLSILVEEVGEASHELTYDAKGDLRAELIDIITVATAWVAALDSGEEYVRGHFDGDGCVFPDSGHFTPKRPIHANGGQ